MSQLLNNINTVLSINIYHHAHGCGGLDLTFNTDGKVVPGMYHEHAG